MSREQDAFNTVVEGPAVSVKTYRHNIPTTDNPEDHSEGNCPCDPIVDDAAGTVTHQPMPALNAASGPDAGTPEGRPVRPHRSGCGHSDCGELQPIPGFAFPPPGIVDAIREFQSRDTAAPLDESGAAAPTTNAPEISTSLVDAPAPDAELDRLLERFGIALYHDGRMFGQVQTARSALVKPGVLALRRAIHAHVAQVKREPGNE